MKNNVLINNANILTPHGFISGNIFIKNGKINIISDKIIPLDILKDIDFIEIDADDNTVIPGFIDLHTHGANGVDINHADEKDYEKLNQFFAKQGVTSYLPTVAGDSHETTKKILKVVKKAMGNGITGSEILGVHLEGPYLCKKYKGALPEEIFRNPSIEELKEYQQITDNNIRHITLAPENEGTVEFIQKVKMDMPFTSISAGHTGASYETAMECINNGLSHATHTFNAMKMIHHREPGVMGAIFDSDITAEIIPDGKHTHPAMIRLLLKIKGLERVVAVTDSAAPTGLEDGDYKLGGNDIVLDSGDLWLANDRTTRAGSVLTMIEAYNNLIDFADLSMQNASLLTSYNPAKVIGLADKKGSIKVGYDADIIIFDEFFDISRTLVKGIEVYKK